MKVEAVERAPDIEALRDEWDALALASARPTIYNTYDYTMCSWKHFDAHHSSLCVLTVRDDRRLIGLLPLRSRRRRRGLELVLEQAATVEVDRLTLLAEPGRESEIWSELIPVIEQLRWDLWNMAEVTEGSPLLEATSPLAERRLRVSRKRTGDGFLMDLSGSWEEFLAGHKSFRRRLKKFQRLVPDHRVEVYDDPDSVLAGLDLYRQVDARSWKTGEVGISRSAAVQDFFTDLMPQLAAEKRSSIRILRDGSDLLAADITHTFGHIAYLHSAVYAEEAGHHSPGTVFTGLVAKDLMASSITTGDLLTGHAEYLRPWASEEVATFDVSVARRSLKSTLNRAQRSLKQRRR